MAGNKKTLPSIILNPRFNQCMFPAKFKLSSLVQDNPQLRHNHLFNLIFIRCEPLHSRIYLAYAIFLQCKYSPLLRHTPIITAYWSWRPEKFKPKDFLLRKYSKIPRNAGYNMTNFYSHSNLSIKSRKSPGFKKCRCECPNSKQMLTLVAS